MGGAFLRFLYFALALGAGLAALILGGAIAIAILLVGVPVLLLAGWLIRRRVEKDLQAQRPTTIEGEYVVLNRDDLPPPDKNLSPPKN